MGLRGVPVEAGHVSMSNVIQLRPSADVATALRNIADAYERGEFGVEECTVIIGRKVFHAGCVNDAQAAANTVFDCNLAIHKLMCAVFDHGD